MKSKVLRTGAVQWSRPEVVLFLADPRHYPHRPRTVQILETHFAWIFLAGERVYKLKKPLRQASMDYRTLALRRRACRAELDLNTRLAPTVYRRIVPLRRTRGGALTLRAGAGRIVDWLVQMRRLPAARLLDQAIGAHRVSDRDLDHVMIRLGAFFRRATREPMSDRAYRRELAGQIRACARELQSADLALDPVRVRGVIGLQLEWLARHGRVLSGRGRTLRDGHGDLRPEHVFLGAAGHPACVIDCLEFDRRLRRLDPAEEMAFLALECARLGAARLGRDLLERYAESLQDRIPPAVWAFYMSRRALVRAQIAAWHLRDPEFSGQSRRWRLRAHSYLADASRLILRAHALMSYADSDRTGRPRGATLRLRPASARAEGRPAPRRASGAASDRTAARWAARTADCPRPAGARSAASLRRCR